MRIARYLFFGLGLGLFAALAWHLDFAETWRLIGHMGGGVGFVLAVYFVAFALDSLSWQLTLPSLPLCPQWAYRLWRIRMVGEAVNSATPLASLGGEPVKALLMKRYYDIAYQEAAASLVVARTVNLIGLILFLAIGLWLVVQAPNLPPGLTLSATAGFVLLLVGTLGFFLVQRHRATSRTGRWLMGAVLRKRFAPALAQLSQTEDRLARFYTVDQRRFGLAVLLAFANWLTGALELYATMYVLGVPVGWADAVMIESGAQLVRAMAFFIPAQIGVQDGVFVLLVGAVTGQPAAGLAVALVRRLRELVWIGWGMAIGWRWVGRIAVAPKADLSS